MFCAAAALKIGKKFHLWFKMYENTNWIDLVRGINYSRHQYPTRSPCCCTLTVFENISSGARFGKMLMLKLLWPHVLKDTTTIADTWVPITKGGNHTIIKGGIPTNWVKRPTLPSIGMQSGHTLTFLASKVPPKAQPGQFKVLYFIREIMQIHVYEYEECNFWNRPLTECVDVTDQYFRCLTTC